MENKNMKVSIIIPVYKDLQALKIVLQALERQTYQNFEIIIAEDNDAPETIKFLQDYSHLNLIHISQPDTGRNKVIIQNKAIIKAKGEYLIFIDGDIVPFKHFIEYTIKIAKPKRILAGRRVNLDETTTQKIKNGEIDILKIEKNYLSFLWKNKKNREARAEQGIQLNPEGFIYKYLINHKKRNSEILGCNFSCFKNDIVAINGFDEGYHPLATKADDTDLTWRFNCAGYELFSSKNIANCFHLWHQVKKTGFDDSKDKKLMEYNKSYNIYKCKNGLDKYE